MNANRLIPPGFREGYREIGRGVGRTPAGSIDPALLRTWYRAFHAVWLGPLCWLAYLLLLAVMGAGGRAHWFAMTEGVVGAIGSLLPIVKSFEQQLPELGQAHRIPLLRHLWGAWWISHAFIILIQCRYHGLPLMKYQSWQLNEWNWVVSVWWLLLAIPIVLFLSALFGGFYELNLFYGRKAYSFFVESWVFSAVLSHFGFCVGANPLFLIMLTRVALLIVRLARPGLTDRWGYANP